MRLENSIKKGEIEVGSRVYVYRNLHKNLYSVRGSNGRVIAHTDILALKDVKYCVGQKGREKVIKTKHKNVHAGLRGTFSLFDNNLFDCDLLSLPRVTYNPYKYNSFVIKETEEPIFESKFAILIYKNEKPVIYAIL